MLFDCPKCGFKIEIDSLSPQEESRCINCGFQLAFPREKIKDNASEEVLTAKRQKTYRRYKITLAVFAFIHFVALFWFTHPSVEMLLSHMREPKAGGVAVEPLKRLGVDAIPAIRKETDNFTGLHPRSAKLMVKIVSSYPRETKEKVLWEMVENNRTGKAWTYLAAIAELGAMGIDCRTESKRIMEIMKSPDTSWLQEEGIRALRLIGSNETVPFLIELLQEGHHDSEIIEALGELGGIAATGPIKNSYPDMSVNEKHCAIVALLRLGDKSGIDLAISEIKGDDFWKRVFSDLLKQYTGQDYGIDKSAWETWWKSSRDTYAVPTIEPENNINTSGSFGYILLIIYWCVAGVCILISAAAHQKQKLFNRVNAFFLSLILVPVVIYLIGMLIDLFQLPYVGFSFVFHVTMSYLSTIWCILLIAFLYYFIVTLALFISNCHRTKHEEINQISSA